jgi:molybdopterin-guanine dinucleotide biosynthesis protein A
LKLAHVEAAVLAGGQSSRMGRDKAALIWDGRPLAERVASALGDCVERVRFVVRPGGSAPAGLERIEDAHETRAPLVGLCAALRACEAPAVLVTACDMPLLSRELLLGLLALVPTQGGSDVVAPLGPNGPEPLLAVYRPRLVPEIERRIAADQLSLRDLLAGVDTLFVPEPDLRALDPALDSLRNANTPADLHA